MKFDVNQLRFLSKDDFRVLQAVELGQRNHEIVPVTLVDSIASLKHGGVVKCLRVLLKSKLVHHENLSYDGYRLTNLGYDFLAIKTLVNRGSISSVGRQIGVGKESDIYEVANEEGEIMALKLHRLGRTSFRAVKSKRDYLKHRNSFSWLYLSRLAALKEFAFMKALGEHGFPVPTAIENNRHAVLMSMVDGYPLVQVRELEHPRKVYQQCMEIMSNLAAKGLIHCDFNEFNLLVNDEEELTLIDFPQMVSVGHGNARELFYRDVDCCIRFFKKKIGYIPEHDPELPYVRPDFEEILRGLEGDIGPELRASGFEREHELTLEQWSSQQPAADDEDEAATQHSGNSEDESDAKCAEHSFRDSPTGQSSDHVGSTGGQPSTDGAVADLAGKELEGLHLHNSAGSNHATEQFQRAQKWATPRQNNAESQNTNECKISGPEQPLSYGQEGEALLEEQSTGANRNQATKPTPNAEAVQDRLILERKRAIQADRMRLAARSAHKPGGKKTRSRGGVNIEY